MNFFSLFTNKLRLLVAVYFLLVFLFPALVFTQNQDCSSCPKKDEKKQDPNQPQPKEYMVGDLKVIEIPSKHSREELERIFPVPEQWKEWYRLEKEGKLPKNIIIKDVSGNTLSYNYTEGNVIPLTKSLDTIENNLNINNLINLKNQINRKVTQDETDFLNELKTAGEYFAFLDRCYYGHYYFIPWWSGLLDILNNFYLYIPPNKDRILAKMFLFNYFYKILSSIEKQPLYYKNEIEQIYKYKQQIWDIYFKYKKDNHNDLSKLLSGEILNILYHLNSNVDQLYQEWIELDPYQNIHYQKIFYDPVNAKEIFYYENQFYPLYDKMFKKSVEKNDLDTQRITLRFFCEIGSTEEYLIHIVNLCKKMLNYNAWSTFYIYLKPFKNTKEVKDLAKFFSDNIDKINEYDRDYLKYFLRKEFDIFSKDKNNKGSGLAF